MHYWLLLIYPAMRLAEAKPHPAQFHKPLLHLALRAPEPSTHLTQAPADGPLPPYD